MAPEHTTHTIDIAKANFRLSLTLGFFFVAFIAFDGKFFRVRVVLHLFAPRLPFNRVVAQAGLQGTPGGTAAFKLEWRCDAHPVELYLVGVAVLEREYY